MTLGSLFDGIGGFPLAGSRVGVTPVWASEIVQDCISITKRHFPVMRHLGDIKEINGGDIEPVDVITFGSPCQDLSISGSRAGLGGEHSGLFIEAVRVIKEMRSATNGTCPTRIVWENVPGAFSSNKGRDFQTVIQEIANIAEAGISIPRPPKKCGWLASGSVLGNNWSLAWRVFNSEHWGVPQHRRRIFLVGDFGSQSAAEILFIEKSETGNIEKGENTGDSVTANVKNGVTQYCIDIGYSTDRIQMNPQSSVTLRANGGGNGANTGLYCLPTDNTNDHDEGFTGYLETVGCLCARDYKGVGNQFVSENKCVINKNFDIRRLTPLECERLQGLPDEWTKYGFDGKRISDNQRYKAIGNSVAIPCVEFVLRQIANNKGSTDI